LGKVVRVLQFLLLKLSVNRKVSISRIDVVPVSLEAVKRVLVLKLILHFHGGLVLHKWSYLAVL